VKIKRFVDKDMRTVLKRVREEQGPDAVILSNQRVAEGIEVIAAVDYDAALMQHALGNPARETVPAPTAAPAARPAAAPATPPQPIAARTATRQPAAAEPVTVVKSTVAPAVAEVNAAEGAHSGKDLSLNAMRSEITSLRGLLETQISNLLWKDSSTRSPMLAQVLRNMARLGIAADIAGKVVERMGPADELKHIWQQPLAALSQLIPVTADRLLTNGGVAALIGPTGVGKTTTIAKLAARYAMHHGTDNVALVCADAYRIGAREHLTAFANILGVKVHSASDPADLGELLGKLRSKKLVLIDTEGVSQRDADLTRRLAGWKQNGADVSFYLTLSATAQEAALDETVASFSQVPLAGAIVTKVDEAGQLGCVLSALIRRGLPLAWVADGQHIPDDLHAAERRKLWLLKRAVDCIEFSQPRIDEQQMAEQFGSVSAIHA
jgi:flagellar biosynthesis protein FlhF